MENVEPVPQEAPEPALHRAARLGDIAQLERLLAEGADLEAGDQNGATPLMIAAGSTDAETKGAVEWLLAQGANPKTTGGWYRVTATWYAAGPDLYCDATVPTDQADRLRILLDASLDANESSSNGVSLLVKACRSGDPAQVRLLMNRGASLTNHSSSDKRQSFQIPLFAASESGSAECVQLLLDAGADVNEVCKTGSFQVTLNQIDLPTVDLPPGLDLDDISQSAAGIDLGAYIDQRIQSTNELWGEDGETALASAGSPEVARLLIAAGARVDAHDWYEDVLGRVLETADTELVMGNSDAFAVADVLLEAGATLDKNFKGEFRLGSAAFRHHAHVVDYLLQHGAAGQSTQEGTTPLHSVCWKGGCQDEETNAACAQIIRSLVRAGFSMDARDSEGRAPLHKATGGDWANQTAVRTLLELGAEPDPVDGYGQTPLHLATRNRALECAVALLEAGANPRLPDLTGNTPIDYAEAEVVTWTRYAHYDESSTEPNSSDDPRVAESLRSLKVFARDGDLAKAQALLKALK
ncbi:MAG: ankyrin repeat domain-containing protein [Armatimonadetes bacterium]|nr:ankyrin repeat domain-containing protein [Armatimonadota bacterium]